MSRKNIYLIKKLSNLTKNIDVCLLIVILIDKHAFFEPTKFFCKNLLQPSFTYDGTLLSCKKSDPFFSPNLPPNLFFFENRAPSHFGHHHFAPLYQKSKDSYDSILRKVGNRRTDERTQVNL